MPKFYFNIDGAPSAPMTFEDLIRAKVEALLHLARVASETPHAFWQEPMLGMTVTDEAGKILFTLRLVGTVASGAS